MRYGMGMSKRILLGTVKLPKKGSRQFQPNVKEAIVDEWRALGFRSVSVYRDGMKIVIDPVKE